jgi:hypothetical protein
LKIGTANDRHRPAASAQPPGLSLRLKQGEDVTLPNRALDVPHDETVLVVQELHSDLGHLTPGAGAAHHLDHDGELNLGVHAAQHNCVLLGKEARSFEFSKYFIYKKLEITTRFQ